MNQPIADILKSRKYDPNREPPVEQVIMRIENKNIGAVQNLVTVTAMQKSGKTRFISGMVASAITRTEILGVQIRLLEGKHRIGLIDTEQGEYDFYKMMQQTKRLAGIESFPTYFDAYNTREDDPKIRIAMVEEYLKQNPDCGILFVDGLLDLIISYNDETQSQMLINHIKRWTKIHNILMVCALHLGKSSSTTVGHIGSMADRASQSVLRAEKNKDRGTFILKGDYLRSCDDFTPIEIYYDNTEHTWKQTFYIAESKDEKVKSLVKSPVEWSITDHRLNLQQIFNATGKLSYREAIEGIKAIYPANNNWAKDCFAFLIKEGMIYKTGPDNYSIEKQAKMFAG